jgi:hypothetical protein
LIWGYNTPGCFAQNHTACAVGRVPDSGTLKPQNHYWMELRPRSSTSRRPLRTGKIKEADGKLEVGPGWRMEISRQSAAVLYHLQFSAEAYKK